MLRPLRKPHPPLQPISHPSSSPLSHVSRNSVPTLSLEHSHHNHKSNFSFIPNPCKASNLPACKNASTGRSSLKENNPMSQNTPKRIEAVGHDPSSDEVDHLSQIKFISKECSSIKENNNDDCISFSNSNNHLDDFSPLFDASEQDNEQKEEFTVEIESIGDNKLFFPRKEVKKNIMNSERSIEVPYNHCGKIKKNSKQAILKSEFKQPNINRDILQVFKSLDSQGNSILSKTNCANDTLTTQLNYLIGSIISKIKVKNHSYGYQQFQYQFKRLINDFNDEEIVEILQNNRRKRLKKEQKLQINDQQLNNHIFVSDNHRENKYLENRDHVLNKSNKFYGINSQISKINQKLNSYLIKNKLINTQQNQQVSIKNTIPKYSQEISSTKNKQIFFSQTNSNSRLSTKSDIQTIKRFDGSTFQLYFMQLNKNRN